MNAEHVRTLVAAQNALLIEYGAPFTLTLALPGTIQATVTPPQKIAAWAVAMNSLLGASKVRERVQVTARAIQPATVTPKPAPAPTPSPPPAPTPQVSIGVTYDPPLVITRGGWYGNRAWRNTDPLGFAVRVDTSEPVIIENFELESNGLGITCRQGGAQVTIRQGTGRGLNPNVAGRSQDRFVDVQYAKSFLIEHLTFDGFTGIYINSHINMTDADPKLIRAILARNINGQHSDGNGGYRTGDADFYRGQAVQFNNLKGVSPTAEWVRVINEPRKSHVEDCFSAHVSVGKDAANPIRFRHVLVEGAFQWRPEGNFSGGGVILGDGGGKFQEATECLVLEASNYGMAVAGGDNMRLARSTILGTGRLPDGTILDSTPDAGLYIRDTTPGLSATVIAEDMWIGWGRPLPTEPGRRSDLWVQPGMGVSRNISHEPGAVTEARKLAARDAFLARAAAAGVTFGRTA